MWSPSGHRSWANCVSCNDEWGAFNTPKHWKYVDDIMVAEACNPALPTPGGTQSSLSKISANADTDHLTLNINKCTIMQCFISRRKPPTAQIFANNKIVPAVSNLALLGVTLIPSLKWDTVVQSIIKKRQIVNTFSWSNSTSPSFDHCWNMLPLLGILIWLSSSRTTWKLLRDCLEDQSSQISAPGQEALGVASLVQLSTRRQHLCPAHLWIHWTLAAAFHPKERQFKHTTQEIRSRFPCPGTTPKTQTAQVTVSLA